MLQQSMFSECGQSSIKVNVAINAKIESKKLELSSQKCHQIHVGKSKEYCPELNAHTEPIEKYWMTNILVIKSALMGLMQKNIEARISDGMGTITNIIMMLEELSLGHFYFEIIQKYGLDWTKFY